MTLTLLPLRSHIQWYPLIIVSNHHKNTSKHWIEWPLQKKLWPKIIDSWMTFDPTSIEVTCVTPPKDHCSMGIHQCMQIQWSILEKTPYNILCSYTYMYTANTYVLWMITQPLSELSSGETIKYIFPMCTFWQLCSDL